MRVIRLEEIVNETVLPETIQSTPDISKDSIQMESPKLTPKNKHDQARKGTESHYREDEAVR